MAGGASQWLGRRQQQLQTLRPLRALALLRAYGWQGLARHGLSRLQLGRPQAMQLWRWRSQEPPLPGPAQVQELTAGQVIEMAAMLRPFKRGIDGLARELASADLVGLAWLEQGAVLGVTFLRPLAPGQWLSHDTFVFPAARRQGLGEQLVRAATAHARQVDAAKRASEPIAATAVWGEVLPYNRASQAMLQRCGWHLAGEMLSLRGRVLELRPAELGYPLAGAPKGPSTP